MAKSKRTPRAKNKIEGGAAGELIKVDVDPYVEVPRDEQRVRAVAVTRSTLFTAEFEAVIEIIATERVYRAMLAGLGRRMLTGPAQALIDSSIVD
jgi:hypothetical protein